ncbi:MAG: copper-binding protein [Sphingomonadaceae bacterium]|mgnify:CR=1 FL=1|jgi:Cu(I)/Ag(I) efflux system protein CusF|nr:copper-binding protein [Sphingomonadaceae bacterium]
MNIIQKFITVSALALGIVLPVSSMAQTAMDHSKMDMSQTAPSMTEGEVKKVDQEAGKVTIKHGVIKHLDMPGMTMVFTAKDKGLLTNVKPGDKVQFMVVNEGGKMIVSAIATAP